MITFYDVQVILSGIGKSTEGNLIQAAAANCRRSKATGEKIKDRQQQKEQEERQLIEWSNSNGLWLARPDESRYLTRGAEQLVYLDTVPTHVLKFNDAIFYQSWLDYFHSLLLHNLFFPVTAYKLLGFSWVDEAFCAVVQQPFVLATAITDIDLVHAFMEHNGFEHIRNHDFEMIGLG